MKKIGFLLLFVLSTIFLHGCGKSSEHHQISADPIPSGATMISQNIIPGGYLYRNLDLNKEADKAEYDRLQKDKNLILEYQTKTSSAVNKFIDTIHQDLLEACKHYGTTYETNTGTYYERDVCVDRYISKLYYKLQAALASPQTRYSGKDPVLLSYYQDLAGDHPFLRYFVDLYSYLLKRGRDLGSLPEWPNGPIQSEQEGFWDNFETKMYENKTGFYTFSKGNLRAVPEGQEIASIADGIVVHGDMLERITKEYGYTFHYGPLDINSGTAPMYGPFVFHHKEGNDEFIYQIISSGGGSGEFYLLVRRLSNEGLRLPLGECGYLLFRWNPQLFGECKERQNSDPLTIFTQEDNLYEHNTIYQMAENFTFFLRALESIRVLSK
ncbi:MAG: hypothetical protein DLD55_00455 [candidate division SR1 bacterium]|nr:MAG: hypothetical protein DLD55_00455 [candidate division SR1 bacterium]